MQFSKYIRVLTSCHILVDKVEHTAPCVCYTLLPCMGEECTHVMSTKSTYIEGC